MIYLRDVLKQLSPEVRKKIWNELIPYMQSLKADVAPEQLNWSEQLVNSLTSQEILAPLWVQLSTYEQAVLRYFIFQVGDDLLTYRQIEEGRHGFNPTTFRLGLVGLCRKGFIYTLRRQWGEVAYILPADLAQALYALLLRLENREALEPCQEAVQQDTEWIMDPIYIDAFLLLIQLRTEKEGAVPLTKRGSIHKRYVRAWQELWPEREALLDNLLFVYEHRDTYTKHMAILLDFLTRKQLISWYEDRLVLHASKTETWMQSSRDEMRKDFLAYWTGVYRPSAPWLRRYQQDMLLFEHTDWVYLLSFVERWEEEYSLPNIAELKQLIREELLKPLIAFGLIETGKTETGEEVWRWKREEETLGSIWIQPNLEIYCPNTIPFSLLWELTKLLDLEKWERMLVMTLSKTKVLDMVEQGENLMEWVRHLEDRLNCSFPSFFVEQLTMWARSGFQARLSKKMVLEIEDDYLSQAWLAWPELNGLEVIELKKGVYVIDVDKEEAIQDMFAKRGIPLHVSEEKEQVFKKVTRNFLISSPIGEKQGLKVESVFPDFIEAVPIWNRLPELWKKQLSPYHEKTKRLIIQQAVEHGLRLKVETSMGELMELVPRLVQVEEGRWVCYDVENQKYELEKLTRLQLLFPVQTHSC